MLDVRALHPTIETLAAFGLGCLSETESRDIELHLEDCESCRQKLEEVPDDALIRLLQASASERPGQTSDTRVGLLTTDTDASLFGESAVSSDPSLAPLAFVLPRELEKHARYHVLGSLGAGGMGTVYKARHRLMDRVVALKIVNPLLVNKPGAVERFAREVRAAAQLVHRNIVTAHDAETVGGLHLLVMEYVEGQTLAQILDEQHELPIAHACEYLRQTATGLQYALELGMVHRDIKPQNLMLVRRESSATTPEADSDSRLLPRDSEPVIKILDFGLARFVSEATQSDGATEVGMIVGSPDYMAPEQALDAHAADTRADIYGMGCTLYHLLTGQVPFPEASLLAKLEAHRDKLPIPLAQLRPGAPAELAKVVARMMAKDPAARYSTPAEVALALRPFAQEQPALPARAQQRGWEVGLKTRIAVALSFLVVSFLAWQIIIRFTDETGKVREVIAKKGEKIEIIPDPKETQPTGDPETAGPPPPRAIAPFTADEAKAHQAAWAKHLGTQVQTTNSVGAKMILIPPGEFLMGSSDEQVAAALAMAEELGTQQRARDFIQKSERPQHRVVISKPFLMGATEVTIGQFKRFAAATGYKTVREIEVSAAKTGTTYLKSGYRVTNDSPAAVITWSDAVAYCNWLSDQEHAVYRLPTEAEWEYACRAGSATQFSSGDGHVELGKSAWYRPEPGVRLNPAGTKLSNSFGLFDMQGNVFEWCHDFWDEKAYEHTISTNPTGPPTPLAGSNHVIRGGSWNSSAPYCRSAYRSFPGAHHSDDVGFRCVREW